MGLETGEKLAAFAGEHSVAVALEPEWGGAGGADDAVCFEAQFGGGELGVGLGWENAYEQEKERQSEGETWRGSEWVRE